jgi:phospholipase C
MNSKDSNGRPDFDDPGPGTDYRSPAPFKATVSRRRFFQLGAAAAGAAALAGAGELTGTPSARAATLPTGYTGTISDLKHVVILMQENRSFDHYYGSLQGVRGFSDKQAVKWQNGNNIFQQPDTARTDTGYLLPFHMDSTTMNAQNAGDLDHGWDGDHEAMNGGLWNSWVPAKTQQTMGYFTRADLPFNYALADAFTDSRPDEPEPDVLLGRHFGRLDLEPAGLHGRVQQHRHLPRTADERRYQLAGVHQPRGRRRRWR